MSITNCWRRVINYFSPPPPPRDRYTMKAGEKWVVNPKEWARDIRRPNDLVATVLRKHRKFPDPFQMPKPEAE